ncbi:putative SpoU type methylase [Trypanosoma rangeli]|uniref:Putative SpoU type methylase n=1 Tax=Trypanosoma rangeli TaxID=5698 RepID=A0A422NV05_TRYRA|nr:putative SpoU type methylase [Trypanosoma rangeli]RNF09297.1 putative SpoU type methylase [Trypanosoma rangeli]|eukprot:RNF09297.1 putative SpoU type methylase [Trypanosoma rangeli]
MHRSARGLLKRDFDAWAYNIRWPQRKSFLPLLGVASLTVEDIKFAYNAWCLLRLAMFFGTGHPKILSPLVNTTPSMDIMYGGNRLFYMHADVGAPLSHRKPKVALTPCYPNAWPLQSFPWRSIFSAAGSRRTQDDAMDVGVEIVLGMENGLSASVVAECDYCLYIPQYGSIGSLSMMSAMAIALHSAASAHNNTHTGDEEESLPVALRGHMPQSHGASNETQQKDLPHEKNLLSLSNAEIVALLGARRLSYPMQLSVMVHNEFGDRNIGAIMRNANAFNCEQMIVLNRRKFNRRGAVGTQHLLQTTFYPAIDDIGCQQSLAGYTIWLLYQYYPYLKMYEDTNDDGGATFIRPGRPVFQAWFQGNHRLNQEHPMMGCHASHLRGKEVYLDNFDSVCSAVRDASNEGYRGIMLAVPEEGASFPCDIVRHAQRIAYVVHPDRLAREVQRGLNGALSSAIALERLRTAVDCL